VIKSFWGDFEPKIKVEKWDLGWGKWDEKKDEPFLNRLI